MKTQRGVLPVLLVISCLAATNLHSQQLLSSVRPKATFSASVRSEKSDFLGLGKVYSLNSATGTVFVGALGDNNGQLSEFSIGWKGTLPSNASESWGFSFRAPRGQALATGSYLHASDFIAETDAMAIVGGFEAGHNSSGCDHDAGQFTITQLAYDCEKRSDGFVVPHITRLAMQFVHYCDQLENTPNAALRVSLAFTDIAGIPCDSSGGDNPGGGTPTPTPQPQPTTPIVLLSDDLRATPIVMGNAASTNVLFSTFVPATVTGNVTLSAASDADNLTVSVNPAVINATGNIDAVATIKTAATTLAGDHTVTITATGPDGSASSATIFVTVLCDPPFILGIDQPKGSTVALGRPAQLSVKASGSGPFTYQWFTGASGLSNFPLPGGTSPNFTTSALNDTTSYWVRITNPCGSVNSQTATVNVTASAKPTGRR